MFTLLSLSVSAFEVPTFKLPLKESKVDSLKLTLEVIKYKESRGNYNAIGSKSEIGAYQIMPPTWNTLCKRYFKRVLKPTRYNQDLIARYYVTELLQKYNVKQIASIWNCGRETPNNKDTVKYVEHFLQIFNSYLSQSKSLLCSNI